MAILTPHTYHTYPVGELGMDGPYVSRAIPNSTGLSIGEGNSSSPSRSQCQNPDSPTPRFWVSPRTYSSAWPSQIWTPQTQQIAGGVLPRLFRLSHAVPTTAKIIIQVAYNLEKVASACKATMSGFMYPVLCEMIGFYQLLTQGKRTLSRRACP